MICLRVHNVLNRNTSTKLRLHRRSEAREQAVKLRKSTKLYSQGVKGRSPWEICKRGAYFYLEIMDV